MPTQTKKHSVCDREMGKIAAYTELLTGIASGDKIPDSSFLKQENETLVKNLEGVENYANDFLHKTWGRQVKTIRLTNLKIRRIVDEFESEVQVPEIPHRTAIDCLLGAIPELWILMLCYKGINDLESLPTSPPSALLSTYKVPPIQN